MFLMFLVVLGISKGLWSSLWSSPLAGKVATEDWELAVSEKDTAVEEKQDCLGDAVHKTMKSSNDTLKAGRQSSSGTMDFVGAHLEQSIQAQAGHGHQLLSRPCERQFR